LPNVSGVGPLVHEERLAATLIYTSNVIEWSSFSLRREHVIAQDMPVNAYFNVLYTNLEGWLFRPWPVYGACEHEGKWRYRKMFIMLNRWNMFSLTVLEWNCNLVGN
jgi:hypothetical protein